MELGNAMAVSTWIREIRKFPPAGTTWRWTNVVGHDDGQVKPRAAHAVRDLINRNDDGTYEIGGWGAVIEEIEATEITITNVQYE